MPDGSSDTTSHGDRDHHWLVAVIAVGLVAIGLVWLLSNLGLRGPRLVALWEGEDGRGFGIHMLDPLGVIPLAVGEVLLVRNRIASIPRAIAGTLVMAVGIVWLTRSAVPQGPRLATLFGERGVHGSDVVGIVCIAAAIALLLVPTRRPEQRHR